MELNSFAQVIREQFVEDDINSIEIGTNFRSLDTWDSLTGMAILAVIADDYQVDIPVDTFRELNTIEELFNFVKSNQK